MAGLGRGEGEVALAGAEDRRTAASLPGPGSVSRSHGAQVASSLLRPADVQRLDRASPEAPPPSPGT